MVSPPHTCSLPWKEGIPLPLVYACITPHGIEIIPELAGPRREAFAPTRLAMEELGRRVKACRPEVIIVATPHGLRLEGGFNAVVTSEYCSGLLTPDTLTPPADPVLEVLTTPAAGPIPETPPAGSSPLVTPAVRGRFLCDRLLAREIVSRTRREGIPVVGVNYGALAGPASDVAMDWGTLIPLYFLAPKGDTICSAELPQVVLLGPSRDIPLTQLVRWGEIVGSLCVENSKRIVFVASADQAHCHRPEGPYGYHPAAAQYDALVQDIVTQDRLDRLLDVDLSLVDEAKPDSLWQMLILYGISRIVPLRGQLLSYQAPTYFGMLVAAYAPSTQQAGY